MRTIEKEKLQSKSTRELLELVTDLDLDIKARQEAFEIAWGRIEARK